METKIFKKLLVAILIVMLTATDFFMLGSGIISYAVDNLNNSTNNKNIEFATYFKNEKGEKIEELTTSIDKQDLKLYAKISVKEEGYFNGALELNKSNFKFKNEISSSYIKSIEENKVTLNQINAGETVEIELGITPIISQKMILDDLTMSSEVKLTGTYLENTYKGKNIEAEKNVTLKLIADEENTKSELNTEIITNKIYEINGENKRIVQLSVKSNVANNSYPIKQTTLKMELPQFSGKLPEEVKVLAIGTEATNGLTEGISTDAWKSENGNLQITINNEVNENGEISWKKGVTDKFIITLIYDEAVDTSKVETKINSEIELYNQSNKLTAESISKIENTELNNIITSTINFDNIELYKGQLYANTKLEEAKDIQFNSTTQVEIRNKEVSDSINIKETNDIFKTEESELNANTKFIQTKINKNKILELFGEDGYIEIKNGDTIYSKINKDSEADEAGNIIINYNEEIKELEINTSKPVKEGILEINNLKAITKNDYGIEQLREVKELKSTSIVTAFLGQAKVVEKTTEQIKELKETTSKAELTVSKQNLSTMVLNKEVILGVKLNTNNTKYDLYKNPTIKIKLPDSVEEIDVNSFNKLYGDEFEITKAVYNKASKTIEIELNGEQLEYAESDATQLYIQINLNVKLSEIAANGTDKITMEYTNENSNTEINAIEKEIRIIAPNGLVAVNNIETYDIQGISGTSEEKQVAKVDKKTAGGSDAELKIALVNNTENTVNNVKVLGNFPTNGEFTQNGETVKNNFETKLKSAINAENAKVYYSANDKATTDITNTKNGWTQDLSQVQNPKTYLIEIESIDPAKIFEATYSVELAQTLDYDLTSYAGYNVSYNEDGLATVQNTKSTLVGLTTGEGIKLETNIIGTVGNDTLKDGDSVKAGEVIKYKVTVKNSGTENLENVKISAGVPTGTALVVPEDNFVYSGTSYYKELTDTVVEKTATIEAGKEYTMEYEVRAKSDITNGTEISNKAIITYGEYEIQSNELKNILMTSNIRVTVKRTVDVTGKLSPGSGMTYLMFVENLSNEAITNLNLDLVSENFKTTNVYNKDTNITDLTNGINKISISEIPANDVISFRLNGVISEGDISTISMSGNVTDSNKNVYRSNKDVQSVEKIGAKITLTTPNEGAYVKEGDEITYNITVSNTGTNSSTMLVRNNISDYLEIESLYIDDELQQQTINVEEDTFVNKISNDVYVSVKEGQSEDIKIVAKVKELDEKFEVKTITNFATVSIDGKVKDTSAEVTHLLQGSVTEDTKHVITGTAWLDENQNGEKDSDEKLLQGINVKLFDVSTNSIAKNKDGELAETTTDSNGEYIFTRMNEGEYIVMFEFDTTKYELTTYMKEGVSNSKSSNAVLKSINIDGVEKQYGVTDSILLTESVSNINIGLKENLNYDMELDKYISRITIQNSEGTKSYDYTDSTFQKVEINRKRINGSMVVLEYTIRVKNTGEIAGYITNIKDYLPSGLEFSSELNQDWYISEGNLYTKSLANTRIEPGESKDIKLILTKNMTEDNVGLINNRAEIMEDYNEYGKADIDSTANNQVKDEDDMGAADVLIAVSTGGTIIAYIFLAMINTALIAFAIYLIFIKNRNKR